MLHHDIHSKLMSGDVVILPVGGQINQWQCIVTNEELKKEKAMNSMLWEVRSKNITCCKHNANKK